MAPKKYEPRVKCVVCHGSCTIEDFRVFTDTCHNRICPICKTPTEGTTAKRVYLHFTEPAKPKISVVEGLDKIDLNTPAVSISRAAKEIRKAEIVQDTLAAAKRLEDRLYPLAEKLQEERQKNTDLLKQNAALKERLAKAEASLSATINLQDELKVAKDDYDNMAGVVRKVTRRAEREKERHDRAVLKLQRELETKDEELQSVKALLEDKDKEIHLSKVKLKALAKQAKAARLKPKAPENIDESLQIEGMPEEIENPRKKRRMKITGDQ
ncbi:hypothetical protein H0H81_006091 [Sphagnurus paluster]|uniref:Uncharacterized protein n=1 Tax=Sphagnurus paluster TaxID=117069 RepID=A0A9P7G1Q6_9AGAR|nr:hypothetical protein H0H81_006091 [Sphagnurus paluster]